MMGAGEIATHFVPSSRPGISRHLRVLRECGVVTSARRGREQIYSVNAQPLGDIRDGYLASFAKMQVDSLKALRHKLEGDAT
jgi:DNA-binding transcriptional ArsR family regulator